MKETDDTFTDAELTAAYDRGMEQVQAGKVHVTTLEELEQAAKEAGMRADPK